MATPTNLPASFSVGAVLTADQMNNLRGAFRTLQSAFGSAATTVSSASTTYVTTGVNATLTPQSTSNVITIQANISLYNDTAGGEGALRIVRTIGATTTTVVTFAQVHTGASQVQFCPILWQDSPATTSAVTYTIQFSRNNGTGNIYAQVNSASSSILIQEISA